MASLCIPPVFDAGTSLRAPGFFCRFVSSSLVGGFLLPGQLNLVAFCKSKSPRETKIPYSSILSSFCAARGRHRAVVRAGRVLAVRFLVSRLGSFMKAHSPLPLLIAKQAANAGNNGFLLPFRLSNHLFSDVEILKLLSPSP